uniref:Beta-lactamase-related domain-containing protein n=1 Tax=Globodera rostochiensis TaxID=31243 RepID=A0A914I7H7_GLORO
MPLVVGMASSCPHFSSPLFAIPLPFISLLFFRPSIASDATGAASCFVSSLPSNGTFFAPSPPSDHSLPPDFGPPPPKSFRILRPQQQQLADTSALHHRWKRRAMDLNTKHRGVTGPNKKCSAGRGGAYGEREGDEGKQSVAKTAMKSSGTHKTVPFLQLVHPASPREKDWVLVAGGEKQVDNVLACSLSYGGRLVSMDHFRDPLRENQPHYYAIMHRFSGPVFLKPESMSFSELLQTTQENEELDMALTQLCGHDEHGDGRVQFSTYWERVPGVSSRIWFAGSPESDLQKALFEKDGFRLISLCGYSIRKKTARFVGVWQKPVLRTVPYEAHYGITLSECVELNDRFAARDYVAVQFRVFRNLDEVLCCAIWEHLPGRRHWVEIGDDLRKMLRKFGPPPPKFGGQRPPPWPILPRQISHFHSPGDERLQFVVLWSDVHSFRHPRAPDIWPKGQRIPANYLAGTEPQLEPTQLEFIAKRVERFMRELDIPGLSVAISRDEQLKYAAGFGYGNVKKKLHVTPNEQFRIGSVSKPITAAAILLLVDKDSLKLEQRVFGPSNSIFGNEFARQRPYGKWVTDITVRHLLEHTSGGWNNVDSDPAWLEPDKGTVALIEKVLTEQPLIVRPGKAWIYSNFGYQLLGHIIERIAGMDYEQFVKRHIWQRIGVKDIQVARPSLSEKSRREVLYYMGGGNRVGFNPYDLLPPGRIGPWGGWIASPIELLRLMAHLDGFKRRPDLLSDWALREWATPTEASNETYGLGWSLNIMGFNGWQHDGRMPGSASMLVRLDNGLEMAVVVNKEYSDRDFFHELGYILHHIGNNCDWWKDAGIDLFPAAGIV